MRAWWIKLFNWEYWSFGMVYIWICPVWFFLCLRARSFFFFSASNPSIENGGFLNESKKKIYHIMPAELYPPTLYFNVGDKGSVVVKKLKEAGFNYPLIGKPDVGGRGRGVKILHTDEEVIEYCKTTVVEFHIQQFVSLKKEAGIFYYRFPGTATGKLSGIVRKEFLSVTGDGINTISNILLKDKRAFLHRNSLQEMYGEYLNTVLPAGEEKLLVPYGNHARGAKFLDDSHLIDEQLTTVIDNACRQIKNFYYGRLDIRYNTWEELRQGKNFCIIEVNGAGSEPTHMYDPKHSLFFAWKEIIRHWILLWRISRMNHNKGYQYLSFKEGTEMFRIDKEHSKKLAQMPA
jgi:hypothetical protein